MDAGLTAKLQTCAQSVGGPRQSRMAMLMNAVVAKLDPRQTDALKDHLETAPKLPAVTALRLLVDPK
jgi:hypothetical protein